jgi:hypothetical protein
MITEKDIGKRFIFTRGMTGMESKGGTNNHQMIFNLYENKMVAYNPGTYYKGRSPESFIVSNIVPTALGDMFTIKTFINVGGEIVPNKNNELDIFYPCDSANPVEFGV